MLNLNLSFGFKLNISKLKSLRSKNDRFFTTATRRLLMSSTINENNQFILPSGLLAINKPQEWTSADLVAKIRGKLQYTIRKQLGIKKVKIKVGHGGTLDPMATGVMVLGIGHGTKLMADMLSGSKAYHAEARLGFETHTLDVWGNTTVTKDCSHITNQDLIDVLPQFTGDIMQIPPMVSALKKDGKRLYDLAREGIEVEREARPTSVYKLEMLDDLNTNNIDSDVKSDTNVDCGKWSMHVESSGGFYVRTLIEDIGRAVGGAAHMTALLRVKAGPFVLDDCLPPEPEAWTFEAICEGINITNGKVGLTDLPPAFNSNNR